MGNWEFEVPISPVSWARARVSHQQGQTRFFTPTAQASASLAIRAVAVRWGKRNHLQPISGPVHMAMQFFFEPPRSLPHSKRAALIGQPFAAKRRYDMDNLEKLVLDSLAGVVFEDDGQISSLTATKKYAEKAYVRIQAWEDL